jgi:hypothetical protein
VVMALVAGGRTAADPVVAKALAFLAANQGADGTWADANPNSTALAALAIRAAGFDAASPCWRDTAAPDLAGDAYVSPLAALRALQADDGHFVSPFDDFGVNTFGTAQALQALSGGVGVLPVIAAAPSCDSATATTTTTTTTVAPVTTAAVPVSSSGSAVSTAPSTDLPFTGRRSAPLALVAVALVAAGGLASALARSGRRPARR